MLYIFPLADQTQIPGEDSDTTGWRALASLRIAIPFTSMKKVDGIVMNMKNSLNRELSL